MGDYSTMRVSGTVKKMYREKLRWFFATGPLTAFKDVFSLDGMETQDLAEEFIGMDRASFTLWGQVCYAEDRSWYQEESLRNKVGEDGHLLILGSSKNQDTHLFFLNNLVPILFEEGYEAVVTEYL